MDKTEKGKGPTTAAATPTCWDVGLALADVCREIVEHVDASSTPNSEQLAHWLEWIVNANQACQQLHHTCEDLVELGCSPERVQSIEQALAYAQGQERYWWRKDRW